MKYTSISEIGLIRKENQDYVAVVENDNALLAVVCDGIGGRECRICCESNGCETTS